MELRMVDPRTLLDNPTNPRGKLPPDHADLQLEASVREHGILQPPAVRERPKGLTVRWGSRRVRAALAAGLPEIPVLVLGPQDPEGEDEMRALIENVARKNMSPVDQWREIEKLASGQWTEDAIACVLALPVRTIQKLRLLGRIHPPMLERMHLGDMPNEGQLRAIAAAPAEEQAQVWKKTKPKRGENVAWYAVAQALAKRRFYARDAAFGPDEAAAFGIVWEQDLFAPADEDSRSTTRIDAYLAAQQAWLEANLPEGGSVVPLDQYGRPQLPKGAHESYRSKPGEGDLVASAVDPRTGEIRHVVYHMPQKRAATGAEGRGDGTASALPAKPRAELTQKGAAMVGVMRTGALHAALRAEPIDDLRLVALLVLALGGRNVTVKSGEAGMEMRHDRLSKIAACVMEGGVVASDPDAVRRAARAALAHVLSCREDWSRSGAVARVAGDAIGADAHLPNMATADFLSCLSKPAIERVAAGLGAPIRPTGKATRAAVVARVGEGRWVYPEAAFSAGAEGSAQRHKGERRCANEDAGPDEPGMEAPSGGGHDEDEPSGDAGGEDGWLEQAYDEGVAEVA